MVRGVREIETRHHVVITGVAREKVMAQGRRRECRPPAAGFRTTRPENEVRSAGSSMRRGYSGNLKVRLGAGHGGDDDGDVHPEVPDDYLGGPAAWP
jgi:hypothetical protein